MTIGLPNVRSSYIAGLAAASLPSTLFTVPAGKIWRLWDAEIQLNFRVGTTALTTQSNVDAWIEIQGGDILVATSAVLLTGDSNTGIFGRGKLNQGGRPLDSGSVIRAVATALPANTVIRVTFGALWTTS